MRLAKEQWIALMGTGAALLLSVLVLWNIYTIAASFYRSARIAAVTAEIPVISESEDNESEGEAQPGPPAPPSNEEQEDDPYKVIRDGLVLGIPPAPPSPQLTAIVGEQAIIDNRPVSEGEMISDGSKVLEILSNKVIVEKDGAKRDLVLFQEVNT